MSQLSKNLLKTTQKLAGDGVTSGAVVAVCKDHPARDGDCEKIRAGIPAAARRVNLLNDSFILPSRKQIVAFNCFNYSPHFGMNFRFLQEAGKFCGIERNAKIFLTPIR